MKIYAMIFIGSFSIISLLAMQENQQDNSEKFLSIQKRMEGMYQEQQLIAGLDIDEIAEDNSIKLELERLNDEIKSFQPIIIRDEFQKLQVSYQEIANDLEWQIEIQFTSPSIIKK